MKKFNFFLILSICLTTTLVPTVSSFAYDRHQDTSISDYVINEEAIKSAEETPMPQSSSEDELKATFEPILLDIITNRNACIKALDDESLKASYNMDINVSKWAYESEAQKIKYLKNWCEKQAVQFDKIESNIKIRKVKEKEKDLYGILCFNATAFTYSYLDTPDVPNTFYLGTSHYINLRKDGDRYIITKEWYTDPFADSLHLESLKSDEMRKYILSHQAPDYKMDERTQKAMDYAHQYCGVSPIAEYNFKYNKAYKNFNPDGGDCANFASQILHEGAGFKKNDTWNYKDRAGTKAWVNAQAFKNYMVGSGRAGYIAKGTYQQIYKAAYQMRPGDFVAYEKKGKITHISTITGLDSKGYPLVTCHNTDRLLVPYDLGWSDKGIRFHLINVYY
ncbi:MAG: amidase domain-containing protein [Cellulosilyticum sp.]|nr:amidase domain-containing protein [Cellulosilyticum sp.]